MTAQRTSWSLSQMPVLLRGDPELLGAWVQRWQTGRVVLYVAVICVGAGLFGAAMGVWRSPLQAAYGAIKFPLIFLLTGFGNALLNGMLAPLLGLNLRFRESLLAILASFTIAAAILGAFSPLVSFLIWNTPPLSETTTGSSAAYSLVKLVPVAMIAFAGVAANVQLVRLLRRLAGDATIANRILSAWLAVNLLLGSQLSWMLRPFIGSPDLPVEFLRATAFRGNFFENVFRSLYLLFSQ